MNKSCLPLSAAIAMAPLIAIAHPGHDGVSLSDSAAGYSLVHHLLSSEHSPAILLGLLIAVAAGIVLRRLRRTS
jgi:hypothetical protein